MRIVILAAVPAWTLPGLSHLHRRGHYATWLEPLIPAFAEHKDHEIHWITMCKETRKDITYQAYGQTFHILTRGSMAFQMVTGYLTETLRIRKVIKRINPDLVHAWGSEDVYGWAGAFCGIKNRLFTLQGSMTNYLHLIGGNWLFRIQTFYEKPILNSYQHATAESPTAACLIKELNPSVHVNLVDYGVEQAFHNASWNPALSPEVIFIGGLNKRKGISDLIKVAIQDDMQSIRFTIIGDGILRKKLEAISTPNVTWLGRCSRNDIVRQLERGWALIAPTYADTGPSVLKEARVIGLPVITTTAAGANFYIEEGKSGYVGKPGDLDFLKRSILSMALSREKVIEMGKYGHTLTRNKLHPSESVNNFLLLYQDII